LASNPFPVTDQPLVSIIIPTYNRAHLIGETLDSVLAQNYQNWECIVVDDGGTDDTDAVMAQYMAKDSRFRYYHRPKDRLPGGNAARNYGFEKSRGEYVQWFDDDDLMEIDFLQYKLEAFSEKVYFVISGGWYFFSNGRKQEFYIEMPNNLYNEYVLWKINVFTPSILFRRAFLISQELFNEEILKGQESEFFSRIFYTIENHHYKVINQPLFLYRRHEKTKSGQEKIYNFQFKYSTARNHITNLERAIQKDDNELIRYFYKKTLKIYYSAYRNADRKTHMFILSKFKDIFKDKNKWHYFKLKFFIKLGRINKVLDLKMFNHLKYNLPKIQ
jgi:glycosyltransferase involved in cell wall biosynthesis